MKMIFGALLVLLMACAPSPTVSPSPTPPVTQTATISAPLANSSFVEATPAIPLALRGIFVYAAGDGSLWLQDALGGEPNVLVERSTEAIAQMPAFSPDGKRVVYSAMLFLADGNLRGDLRVIDVAAQKTSTLVAADANDVVYFYPRFARDGRLLVTRIEKLQTTEERAGLEWVNAQGAVEKTRVVDDARDADISPDGKQIAFVRYDVVTTRSSLWLVNADGTNAQALVDAKTFTAILNPRFSPDGKWLAFGVHGAAQKNLPTTRTHTCGLENFLRCFVKTAHAHSAPGALWRVNLETKKFQQLTEIYDDSPVPAWSHDSSQIAIHDFTGIRLLDLRRQEIYPLFLEDGGMGGFDWFGF